MSQVTKRALEQSLKNLLLKKPLTKICSASSAYSGCSVTTIRLQRGWIFWIMRARARPFIPGISRFKKAASIGP